MNRAWMIGLNEFLFREFTLAYPEHVSRNGFLREERQLIEKQVCSLPSYRHPCHPWPCLPYVEARHCPCGLAQFPRKLGECSYYAMMNDIRNLNQPSSRLWQTASLTWRPFEPQQSPGFWSPSRHADLSACTCESRREFRPSASDWSRWDQPFRTPPPLPRVVSTMFGSATFSKHRMPIG